jgi:hypothetical protein
MTQLRSIVLTSGLIAGLLAPGFAAFCLGQSASKPGDGGPAAKATLDGPESLAFDRQGNLFFYESADTLPAIREISAETGIVTTLWVGCPVTDSLDDREDCPGPFHSMAMLDNGSLLLTDIGDRLRVFDPKSKKFTIIAGNGTLDFSGDGGPATAAGIRAPLCAAPDRQGNIFVCDWASRIRRIDAKSGIITTFAGSGQRGSGGDHGPALKAEFYFLHSIAVDPEGNLFESDGNNTIRRIDAKTGIIETVAGTGRENFSPVPFAFPIAPGPSLKADLSTPRELTLDKSGNLWFINGERQICKLDLRTNRIAIAAGVGRTGYAGDGGRATRAHIDAWNMTLDPAGNIFFSDWEHNRIRRIDAVTGIITTFAGNGLPTR